MRSLREAATKHGVRVEVSLHRYAVDELLDGDGDGSFRRWHRQCWAAADMFVELVNHRLVLKVGDHMGLVDLTQRCGFLSIMSSVSD